MGFLSGLFSRRGLRKQLSGLGGLKKNRSNRRLLEKQLYTKRSGGVSKRELNSLTRGMIKNSKDSFKPFQARRLRKQLRGLL